MSDEKDLRAVGVEYFKKAYGDALMEPPPEGQDPFFDIMLRGLFGEVWARDDILSLKERRLFTMGIIVAMGEADVFEIQCGCAMRNDELTPEQVRELGIHLAPYAGYPRVGRMKAAIEKAIAAQEKAKK